MTVSDRHIVRIGEGHVADGDCRIETVLGSCVGVGLVWRGRRVFGMAHVVLPQRPSASDLRYTRYGDVAVEYLLRRMGVPEPEWRQVRAVIAGGAEMYEGSQAPVGDSNLRAVRASLRRLGIKVVGVDVGGTHPRRLVIDGATATATSRGIPDGEPNQQEHTWKLIH